MTVATAYYILAINVIAFIVYGIDKLKAKRQRWRIPESALLWLAFFGGSFGAWTGMQVWRHKTKHKKFRYCIPAFMLLHSILLVCRCIAAEPAPRRDSDILHRRLQQEIDSLLSESDADVGLAVCYDGRIICRVNSDREFPLMSVFKLHQAVAVLDCIGCGPLSLDSSVHVTKEMLKPDTYSPLRDACPEGNITLTVNDLLCLSLLQSDNNACDILFSIFGSPQRVQDRMLEIGLCHTQIRWTEDEMHADETRFAENRATPEDAVRLTETAYANDWLRETLTRCATGQNRLPALLPRDKDIRVGHKTGTWGVMSDGTVNGINDAGFVIFPDGRHYSIAVFCNESRLSFEETESLIARISLSVFNHIASL